MSTTFGIFKIAPKINDHGEVDSKSLKDLDYIECAYRSTHGINWISPFDILAYHLKSSTDVYPLDNTQQDVYTIKDIIELIKKQDEVFKK